MDPASDVWENFPSFRWGAESMEIYDAPVNLTSISSVVGAAIRVIAGWFSGLFWRVLLWMTRVALGSKEATELGGKADEIASRLGNAVLSSWILVGGIIVVGFTVAFLRFARGTGRTNNARSASISVLCLVLLIGYVAASTAAHNQRKLVKAGKAPIWHIDDDLQLEAEKKTLLGPGGFLSASWLLDKGSRVVSSLSQYGSEVLNIVDLETQDTEEISESPLDCRYYIDTINRETLAAGDALDAGTRYTAKALSDIWLLLQYRPAANAQWGSSAFSPQVYCRLLEARAGTPTREMHRLTVGAAAGPECEAEYIANPEHRGEIHDIANIPPSGAGRVSLSCKGSPEEPFLGADAVRILGNRVRRGFLFGRAGALVRNRGDEGTSYTCLSAQPGETSDDEFCYITPILGVGAHNEYALGYASTAGRPEDIYSPSGGGRQYIGGIDYYQTVRTANFWAMCRPRIPAPVDPFPSTAIFDSETTINTDSWFLRIYRPETGNYALFVPITSVTASAPSGHGRFDYDIPRGYIEATDEEKAEWAIAETIAVFAGLTATRSFGNQFAPTVAYIHALLYETYLDKHADGTLKALVEEVWTDDTVKWSFTNGGRGNWINRGDPVFRTPAEAAAELGAEGGADGVIDAAVSRILGELQRYGVTFAEIANRDRPAPPPPPGAPSTVSGIQHYATAAIKGSTRNFYDATHFTWELRPEFAVAEPVDVISDIASLDYTDDDTIEITKPKPLGYYFGDLGTGRVGIEKDGEAAVAKPQGGHVCAKVWAGITGEGGTKLGLERCQYDFPLGGFGPIKIANRVACGLETRFLTLIGVEREIVIHDYTNVAPLGGAVFELQPANVSPLEYASNAALNREVRVWMEEANAAGGTGFLSGAFHIALSAFVSMVLFCLIGMILVLVFAAQIMLLVSLALLPVLLLLGVLPFNKTQEALGRIATLIFACIGVKFIVGAYLSAVVVLLYVVLVAGNAILGSGYGAGHLILTGFAAAMLLVVSLKAFRKSLAYAKKLRKESTFRGKSQEGGIAKRAINKAKRGARKVKQAGTQQIRQAGQAAQQGASASMGGGAKSGGGLPPATGGTGGVPPSMPR